MWNMEEYWTKQSCGLKLIQFKAGCYRTYLLFYIVDDELSVVTILRVLQDGMNWQYILKRWINEQMASESV